MQTPESTDNANAARRLSFHSGLFRSVQREGISTGLFVLVLLGAIANERANIVEYFSQAGLVTLTLNIVMMALAYAIARALATGIRQRIAISIECGLQNGTLAITVAVLLFGGGAVVIPAATYSLIMFATSLLFIFLLRKTELDVD